MSDWQCPECDSFDTERVHTDHHNAGIDVVRICNDCPTEFVLRYANPVVDVTHTEGDDAE